MVNITSFSWRQNPVTLSRLESSPWQHFQNFVINNQDVKITLCQYDLNLPTIQSFWLFTKYKENDFLMTFPPSCNIYTTVVFCQGEQMMQKNIIDNLCRDLNRLHTLIFSQAAAWNRRLKWCEQENVLGHSRKNGCNDAEKYHRQLMQRPEYKSSDTRIEEFIQLCQETFK